jgi:hypothetical protein
MTDNYNILKNGNWLSFCDALGSGISFAEQRNLVRTHDGKSIIDVVIHQVARQGQDWPWVSLNGSIYKSGISAKINKFHRLALTCCVSTGSYVILKMETISLVSGEKQVYSCSLPVVSNLINAVISLEDMRDDKGNAIDEQEEVLGFSFYVDFPQEGGEARVRIDEFAVLGFSSPENRVAEFYDKMDLGHMAIELPNCHYIFEFLAKHKITRTLEIGLGEGASAMAILTATGQVHTAMDSLIYCTKGPENLKTIGCFERLRLLKSLSHIALPKLCDVEESFQFTFVAGGCRFEDFFIDFAYASHLTEMGGYIMMPDKELPAMPAMIKYIAANRPDYISLQTPEYSNMCLWQKVAEDKRGWIDHVEF